MAEAEAPAEAPADFTGGEVLFTGMTDWSQAQGRGGGGAKKKTDAAAAAAVERQAKYPNIMSPMRLSGLQVTSAVAPRRGLASAQEKLALTAVCRAQDVRVRFVAAGNSSTSCIVGAMDGRCFTWGRNDVRAAPPSTASTCRAAALVH
jgi:hypothetical protein